MFKQFPFGEKYTVIMKNLTDLANNKMIFSKSFGFSIFQPYPNEIPIKVVKTLPEKNSRNIATTSKINITFNKDVNEISLNIFSFLVSDGNINLTGTIEYDKKNKTAFST